jgi:hypothetical protein
VFSLKVKEKKLDEHCNAEINVEGLNLFDYTIVQGMRWDMLVNKMDKSKC